MRGKKLQPTSGKNVQKWRDLQQSHSGLHKAMLRAMWARKTVKSVAAIAMVSLLGLGFFRVMGFKQSSVDGTAQGLASTETRATAGAGSTETLYADESSEKGIFFGGIALDDIGGAVFSKPRSQLCGSRLFFVEETLSLEDFPPELRGGSVLKRYSSSEGLTLNTCCERCVSPSCQAFLFEQGGACSILRLQSASSAGLSDIDFSKLMDKKYFIENREQYALKRHVEKRRRRVREQEEKNRLRIEESPVLPSELEADVSPSLSIDDEFAFGTAGVDLSGPVDEEISAEDQAELEWIITDGLAVEPSKDSTVAEAETGNEGPVDANADLMDLDQFQEDDLLDSSPTESEAAGQISLPHFENLEINPSEESAALMDFLGIEETTSSDVSSTASDDELLDALLHGQDPAAQLQVKEQVKEKVSARKAQNKEELMTEEQYMALGRTHIREFIPSGDYARLTARDPLYDKYRNLWLRYRTSKELYEVAKDMEDTYGKSMVEFATYGRSGERKTPHLLKSLRIGNRFRGKHLFIVSSLHGCEWTSPLATLHTALALVGRGASTKELFDSMQMHFILLPNPDGFDYSHYKSPSSARTWCKNRRVAVPGYHGVDLERNWGVAGVSWGFGKSDAHAARLDTFQGPSPFSEPETKSLRDYMLHYATGRGRVALLNVKCCTGTLSAPILYNKAIQNPIPTDKVLSVFAKLIEGTDGTKYLMSPRAATFDSSNTGSMIDWAHNEANIDHAYTVELRGSGLATRTDASKISIEPWQILSRELETTVVATAKQLLQIPIQGAPVDNAYDFNDSSSASSSNTDEARKHSLRRKP